MEASVLMLREDGIVLDPLPLPRPNELTSKGAGGAVTERDSGFVGRLPSKPRIHASVGIFSNLMYLILSTLNSQAQHRILL